MAVQRLLDLQVARPGIAIEQRLDRHDHAVAAEAALTRLILDEGALERMRSVHGAQALDGQDAAPRGQHWRDARTDRLAVHQHGAGAALGETAAELRAVELQVVSEYVEERRVRLDRDRPGLAVHPQCEAGHDALRVWRGPRARSNSCETRMIHAVGSRRRERRKRA